MFNPVLNIYIANQDDWDLLKESNFDNFLIEVSRLEGANRIKKVRVFVHSNIDQDDEMIKYMAERMELSGFKTSVVNLQKPIEKHILAWWDTHHVIIHKNSGKFEQYQSIIDNSFWGRFNYLKVFMIESGILFSKDMIRYYELSSVVPRPL